MWRNSQIFSLPQPLPNWFYRWFYLVIFVGILLPLGAMVWWGILLGNTSVVQAMGFYFIMLASQIISESVTLNVFKSCVWVTIPCVYLPYRIWQLYTGLMILEGESDIIWVQRLLIVEIILWIFNYGVHLSQIPRLLRWESREEL